MDGEASHLDFLVDVIDFEPLRCRGNTRVCLPKTRSSAIKKGMDTGRTRDTYRLAQDHDRKMQDEDVCDDHDEDPAYLAFIPHDQMEPRVKD